VNCLKLITSVICLPLSLSLTGCVATSVQRTDRVYTQSMTRAQIQQVQVNQQMKVKQKQKVVQNNHHTNTVYVNQPIPSQPYRANVRQSYDSFAAPVFTPQPRQKDYGYQEDELNRQHTEYAQVEQAKRNSYETYHQDNERRQRIAAEEERQMEQARKNSLVTYAQEEARRQQNAAAEAQSTRRAQEDSMLAAEQSRQHEQQRAQEQATQAAAHQQAQQLAAAEEARQVALAIEESKRTHAEEEARRQQQASASVNDTPPVQPTNSPILSESLK
jgi:hypothetical protein